MDNLQVMPSQISSAALPTLQGISYSESIGSGPPLANNLTPSIYNPKRGSTNTLSTISEVRYSSASHTKSIETGVNDRPRGEGPAKVGGEIDPTIALNCCYSQQLIIPTPWMINQQQNPHLPGTTPSLPPPSATESIKSHWSDDSEDEKKGNNGLFTLVKSTRDSLSRKSSKGSRTSSQKTGKGTNGTSGSGDKEAM